MCVGIIVGVPVVWVRARGVRIAVGRPLRVADGVVWVGSRLASGVVLGVVRIRVAGVGVQGAGGGGTTRRRRHGGALDGRGGQRGGVGEGGNGWGARPAVVIWVFVVFTSVAKGCGQSP